MCTGGRIVHHLRHNLPVPGTAVLMVGFQSPRTLGRQLVDGRKTVTIFGEKIPVRASIHTMGGFSAHAGQSDLLNWLGVVAPSRPRVIITHGEQRARSALTDLIAARYNLRTECPELGDVIEL
jgi:metallo-beta-lactamase family protein